MSRRIDRDRLWGVLWSACDAIQRDGRLRSTLRRARRGNDAIGLRAAEELMQRLPAILGEWRMREEELGALADGALVLLAHPKVMCKAARDSALPAQGRVAQLLGESVSSERRRLSELRFQRLLRAESADDRLQQMRRAIGLLEAAVHPLAVAEAWLDLHSEPGRRRFARAYFGGLPDSDDNTTAVPNVA